MTNRINYTLSPFSSKFATTNPKMKNECTALDFCIDVFNRMSRDKEMSHTAVLPDFAWRYENGHSQSYGDYTEQHHGSLDFAVSEFLINSLEFGGIVKPGDRPQAVVDELRQRKNDFDGLLKRYFTEIKISYDQENHEYAVRFEIAA